MAEFTGMINHNQIILPTPSSALRRIAACPACSQLVDPALFAALRWVHLLGLLLDMLTALSYLLATINLIDSSPHSFPPLFSCRDSLGPLMYHPQHDISTMSAAVHNLLDTGDG